MRAELRERFARSVARWGESVNVYAGADDLPGLSNPAVRRLAALDAGEPFTLPAFMLSRWLTPAERERHRLWTVEADGSLTPAAAPTLD